MTNKIWHNYIVLRFKWSKYKSKKIEYSLSELKNKHWGLCDNVKIKYI